MTRIRKRNQQIVEMRKQGVSRAEVARRLGLSVSRIGFIEQELRAEELLNQKRARIREELRKVDDPDRVWPVEDLIDALEISPVFRLRLLNHFDRIRKSEMNLRELMGLALLRQDNSSTASPQVFHIYGIGKIGLGRLTLEIEGLELGPRCSSERRRLGVT